MESLRENILKQEMQREMEQAKLCERRGDFKKAMEHYLRISGISRKVAFNSPPEKAEALFQTAAQYDSLAKGVRSRESVSSFRELPLKVQEELIDSLIVTQKPDTDWDSIGGLSEAKQTIREAIVLPFIKDKPPFVKSFRTILLYGPPGTGKTMLAKASSNTLEATFFEARTSSLLSKYFGESSKIIRALFDKAKKEQPSLVFMDELDSLAISRSSDISEGTRRVLGELLTMIDGFNTGSDDRVLIMAATNKPWDLDDAILSRFQKKIYVPLPDLVARKSIFRIHLEQVKLEGVSVDGLAGNSEGFSGRDIQNVCREAVTNMVREQNPELERINARALEKYSLRTRPLEGKDFDFAFGRVKPAEKAVDIKRYLEWGQEIGELPKAEEAEAEPTPARSVEKIQEEINKLEKSKELAEKEFFSRKIDEAAFNRLMQEYEEKKIQLRVELKSMKEKMEK